MILKKCNSCIFVVALVSGLLPGLAFSTAIPANKATASKATTTVTENNKSAVVTKTYQVTHVKSDDHLNMRLDAGVSNDIVTTIPFDATGVELLGEQKKVGKTTWVHIKWNGLTGWVSQYYLQAVPQEKLAQKKYKVPETQKTSKQPASVQEEKKTAVSEQEKTKSVAKAGGSTSSEKPVSLHESGSATAASTEETANTSSTIEEEWVLQCGNKSPFWQVQVHPKWMNVLKGDYEADLPIVAKKQDKNRWNTALKTVVKGRNGRNNLKMTIKYAYSRRCYDTLSGLRVPYKVTTEFNGEELTGCCRAVKLKKSVPDETKISLK